jgi:glycosyltransferase involved in cell wall biosynthesis
MESNEVIERLNKNGCSFCGFEVGVIIPAFNEEDRIGNTVKALKGISCIKNILVVDDGSTDQTADRAAREGAEVLRLLRNYGKGYALKKGIENQSSDILLFLDADLEDSAREALKLITPIIDGNADVTIANLSGNGYKGGFGFVRALAAFGVRLLTGRCIKSVLSGQRGFLCRNMNKDYLDYKGFGVEFGMTVDLIKSGAKIHEVDVKMNHRRTKKDLKGFVHRGRQFMDIMLVLLSKLRSGQS